MPGEEIINNCWSNNDDGAGLFYQLAGEERPEEIHIKKGFMTLPALQKYLKHMDFKPEDILALHFRTGTSGTVSADCCHPFPISHLKKKLKAKKLTTTRAVMHNGVLGKGDKDLSDTMVFVKEILSPIKNILDTPGIENLLEMAAGRDRLLIWNKGNITLTGTWTTDKNILYSNDQFKKPKWSNVYTITDQVTRYNGMSFYNGKYGQWRQTAGNNYEFQPALDVLDGTLTDKAAHSTRENTDTDKSNLEIKADRLNRLTIEQTANCPNCKEPVKYKEIELDGIGAQCKKCKLFISDFMTDRTYFFDYFRARLSNGELDDISEQGNSINYSGHLTRYKLLKKIIARRDNVLNCPAGKPQEKKLTYKEKRDARAKQLQVLQDKDADIERFDRIAWVRKYDVQKEYSIFDFQYYRNNYLVRRVSGATITTLRDYINPIDLARVLETSTQKSAGTLFDTYIKHKTQTAPTTPVNNGKELVIYTPDGKADIVPF